MNRFVTEETSHPEIVRIDPAVGRRQTEKLERLRERRDGPAARAAMDRIEQAAAADDNLMPILLDAVNAEVTLGEIANGLRTVWGEHREAVII